MTVLETITAAAGVEEPVQSRQLALSRAIVPEELYRAIRVSDELQQVLREAKLMCEEVHKMETENMPLQQEPYREQIRSGESGFWRGFTYETWMNSKQQHQNARFSSYMATPVCPPMACSRESSPGLGESATVLKRAWKRPCLGYSQMPEMQQQKIPEKLPLLAKVKSEFGDECIVDHQRDKVLELRAEYQRALESASKAEQRPRRIDLQVASWMRSEGRWLNQQSSKIVGLVPGVQVGDLFLYRVEMCMLGLHRQPRAGIDVGIVEGLGVAVAVAVVMMVGDSSAGYADDKEMGERVVYSGQGPPPEDQKLERGNRGLFNSKVHRTPVRLIRGYRGPSGVVYSYDGLYMVEDMIYEKGVAGNMVYKFLLHRMKHQAPLRLLKMAMPLASTAPLFLASSSSSSSSSALKQQQQQQVDVGGTACLPVAGGYTELLSSVCFQDSSLVNFDRAARNLPDLNLNVDDEDDMDYSFLDLDDDEAVLAAKCTRKDGELSAAGNPKKDDLREAADDPNKAAQRDDPTPAFDVPQTGPSADSARSKPTLHIPSVADVLPAAGETAAPAPAVKKSRNFPPLSSFCKNKS